MPELNPEQRACKKSDALLAASRTVIPNYQALSSLPFAALETHLGPSLRLEPEDSERSPFNRCSGPGRAQQFFGEQSGNLLEELDQQFVAWNQPTQGVT